MTTKEFAWQPGTALDGKVALVTGGSRGIGAAIARRLAAEGAAVALTYVSRGSDAERVAAEVGGVALEADAADPAAAQRAVEEAVARLGRLDVLVNNAGVWSEDELGAIAPDEVERVLAIHVAAPLLTTQAAARHLPEGGRVISVGSCLAGRVTGPGMTLYAASKAALDGMTRGLARDLGPRGITVNVVHPGPTDTDMNPAGAELAAPQIAETAIGRFARPEEIAATVAHLAGREAAYITGAAIIVDGGTNA